LLYLYSFITQLLKLMQIILVSDWCTTEAHRGATLKGKKAFNLKSFKLSFPKYE